MSPLPPLRFGLAIAALGLAGCDEGAPNTADGWVDAGASVAANGTARVIGDCSHLSTASGVTGYNVQGLPPIGRQAAAGVGRPIRCPPLVGTEEEPGPLKRLGRWVGRVWRSVAMSVR